MESPTLSPDPLAEMTPARAADELARLRQRIAESRTVLHRLQLEVATAENDLRDSRVAQLLEANRQLVVPALPLPAEHGPDPLVEHEILHAQLREANEQLVFAALGAQTLQAAAEQAQRRQTELLAVVAHELRNPLAPIRAAAALLPRTPGDPLLLGRIKAIIERQVAHMSRLVGDLLDASRVSTGKLRVDRQRVDMAAIVGTAVDTCQPALDKRQQQLDLRQDAAVMEVDGDPVRLTQVLVNLLDNASKYTPDGGTLGLVLGVAGDAIVLTVSDSGIGISAEALPNVFEPFVQDAHAIGFNSVGLGIGLTVVRELVEAHGGDVVASSAGRGRGSQFVVTLPAAR